ncbi:hypothetical protein K1W69_21580 [Hoeflea sp. WL0058]|uniref:Uncharacterized protein n=1 Tax=Flavimaribacter sediminis TaxID=2865987 RepID=A0AAE3D1L3_9HYPH|nr:hypothetical protein [Flavimaribacter sediminis]MBW8639800.1 hypothetical protein [Flavimaribacter sediminis]
MTAGILAYGSLIPDPGREIEEAAVDVKDGVVTPFNVEFARKSVGRRGAPTLVPVEDGQPVNAKIFILNVGVAEAANRLYRREKNAVGGGESYVHSDDPGRNTIVVARLIDFEGIEEVLYTRLAATIEPLTARDLASLAIASATGRHDGRDGVTYLKDAIENGISTRLTPDYRSEVLRQTGTNSLEAALAVARGK